MAYSRNIRPQWHTEKELQQAVNRFHDKYGREPKEAIQDAKATLTGQLKVIEDFLRDEGLCRRVEPTGSCYQGTKIDDGHLEFDVILEMDDRGLEVVPYGDRPSHCLLSPKNPQIRDKFRRHIVCISGKEVISSSLFADKFKGFLTRLKNSGKLGNDPEVILRQHGPALQMDVMRNDSFGVWFSVDLVPSFSIPGCGSFVAKPYKCEISHGYADDHAWYKSFALEEKKMFDAMDQGSRCRKPAVRVLKAAFSRREELKSITSYHIKTLLLHHLKEEEQENWYSAANNWWPQNRVLGSRVMDLLERLKEALENKKLPHFYIPQENLFRNLSTVTLDNMYHRVMRLCRNKPHMMDLLEENTAERGLVSMFSGLDTTPTQNPYSLDSDDESHESESSLGTFGKVLIGAGVVGAIGLTAAAVGLGVAAAQKEEEERKRKAEERKEDKTTKDDADQCKTQ